MKSNIGIKKCICQFVVVYLLYIYILIVMWLYRGVLGGNKITHIKIVRKP